MIKRLFLLAMMAPAGYGFGMAAAKTAGGAEIEYPMAPYAGDDEPAAARRRDPEPPRTQPVTPETAPQFDPIPPITAAPLGPTASAALTPEQKEQLKGLIIQLATLLLGAFLGSGSASPFVVLILSKLLAVFNPGAAPPAAPARAKRPARKAAKLK